MGMEQVGQSHPSHMQQSPRMGPGRHGLLSQDEMSSKRVDFYSSPGLLKRQQQSVSLHQQQQQPAHQQQKRPSSRASQHDEWGSQSARSHDLFNNMPAASGASYGARQPTDTSKMVKTPKQETRKRRAPNNYNIYMREEIAKIKANQPDIVHKDAFKLATEHWAQLPAHEKPDKLRRMLTPDPFIASYARQAQAQALPPYPSDSPPERPPPLPHYPDPAQTEHRREHHLTLAALTASMVRAGLILPPPPNSAQPHTRPRPRPRPRPHTIPPQGHSACCQAPTPPPTPSDYPFTSQPITIPNPIPPEHKMLGPNFSAADAARPCKRFEFTPSERYSRRHQLNKPTAPPVSDLPAEGSHRRPALTEDSPQDPPQALQTQARSPAQNASSPPVFIPKPADPQPPGPLPGADPAADVGAEVTEAEAAADPAADSAANVAADTEAEAAQAIHGDTSAAAAATRPLDEKAHSQISPALQQPGPGFPSVDSQHNSHPSGPAEAALTFLQQLSERGCGQQQDGQDAGFQYALAGAEHPGEIQNPSAESAKVWHGDAAEGDLHDARHGSAQAAQRALSAAPQHVPGLQQAEHDGMQLQEETQRAGQDDQTQIQHDAQQAGNANTQAQSDAQPAGCRPMQSHDEAQQTEHDQLQIHDKPEQFTAAHTAPRSSSSIPPEAAGNQLGHAFAQLAPKASSSLPEIVKLGHSGESGPPEDKCASPILLISGEAPALTASGQLGSQQLQATSNSPHQQQDLNNARAPPAEPDPPHSPLPFPKVTDLPDLLEGEDMEEDLVSQLQDVPPTELSTRSAKRVAGSSSGARPTDLMSCRRSLGMTGSPKQKSLGHPIGGLHYISDQDAMGSHPDRRMHATWTSPTAGPANVTSQVGYMPHGEGEAPALILPRPQAMGSGLPQSDAAMNPAAAAAGMDVLQGGDDPSPTRPHPTPFPPAQLSQLSPTSGMLRSLNKRPTPRPWLPDKWAAENPKRAKGATQDRSKKVRGGDQHRPTEGFHRMFDSDPEEFEDPSGILPRSLGQGAAGNLDGEQGGEANLECTKGSGLLLGPIGGLHHKLREIVGGGNASPKGLNASSEPGRGGISLLEKPRHKQAPMKAAAAEHPLKDTGWVPHKTMRSVIRQPESSANPSQEVSHSHRSGSEPATLMQVEDASNEWAQVRKSGGSSHGQQKTGSRAQGLQQDRLEPSGEETDRQQQQHQQQQESEAQDEIMREVAPTQQHLLPTEGGPSTAAHRLVSEASALQPAASGPAGWLQAKYALKRSASGSQLLLQPHDSSHLTQQESRLQRTVSNLLQKRGSGDHQRGALLQQQHAEPRASVDSMSTPDDPISRQALEPSQVDACGQASSHALQPPQMEIASMQLAPQSTTAEQTSTGWVNRRMGGNPAHVQLVRDLRDIIDELIEDLPLEKRHQYQDRVHASLQQARHRQQSLTAVQTPTTTTHSVPITHSAPTTPVHLPIPHQIWSQPTPSSLGHAAHVSHAKHGFDVHCPQQMAVTLMLSPPTHQPIPAHGSSDASLARSSSRDMAAKTAQDPAPPTSTPWIGSQSVAVESRRSPHPTPEAGPQKAGRSVVTQPSSTHPCSQASAFSIATHSTSQPLPASLEAAAGVSAPTNLLLQQSHPPTPLATSSPDVAGIITVAVHPEAAARPPVAHHPSMVTSTHPISSLRLLIAALPQLCQLDDTDETGADGTASMKDCPGMLLPDSFHGQFSVRDGTVAVQPGISNHQIAHTSLGSDTQTGMRPAGTHPTPEPAIVMPLHLSEPAGTPTPPPQTALVPPQVSTEPPDAELTTQARECEGSPSQTGSLADFSLMKSSNDAEVPLDTASRDLDLAEAAAEEAPPDISMGDAQCSHS
ncbi:hypothetical protein WJX74_005020 [Apatococcus lobatus]|uniref:YABBY protein C-terminal domain-containing protein n=1 Tax=Apatococcus lobatus TaxID=904363 RepID=A0AAW1SG40_9CHLO